MTNEIRRLIDIMEGPEFDDRTLHPQWIDDSYISDQALARDYHVLGSLILGGRPYDFWFKDTGSARVTFKSLDDSGRRGNRVIVDLQFNDQTPNLPVTRPLQVNMVHTDPNFESLGLASTLYIVLAKWGYTIISDSLHYRGGKELWKRLARDSDAKNFSVRIWDDTANDWAKDDTGATIKYRSNNLVDEQVWRKIGDFRGPATLLVLSKY